MHRLDLHRHGDALFGGFQVDVGLEFVRRDVWYEVDEGGVGESGRPALDQYQAAIEVEQADARTDPQWASRRTLRLQRTVAARPTTVWRYWTDADLIRRWWSPEHFTAVECEAKAAPGGLLRIVMAEGDSTRHTAVGRYLALEKPRALSFELAPLGPDGKPLLSAVHRVRLAPQPRGTTISLTIKLGDATPAAAPAIAGLRPGWKQLLDKLARELAGGRPPPAS